MEFKTTRLSIGPIRLQDREDVLDLLTDETVGRTYMLPQYENRDAAEPLFHRLVELSGDETRYVAGVFLDGRFIGMMNETENDGKTIEMGYAYLPAYYNRGYATEAFAGAIRYLLDRGFATVVAGAFAENAPSIRVMEKCAMVRQTRTDVIEYRGAEYTCVYYAVSEGA